jgi:hypothetical protein
MILQNNGKITSTISNIDSYGVGNVTASPGTVSLSGDLVFTGDNNSTLSANDETINVGELIQIAKLMKRVMIDIANDSELSEKLPHVKDAANQWLLDELKK